MKDWNTYIFSETPFQEKAQQVFSHQVKQNAVYRRFCEALGYPPDHSRGAPLLPIRAFKDAELTTRADQKSELVFQSSGTLGMSRSKHLVAEAEIYRQSVLKGFNHFYDLETSVILAYTPGYAENPHSSLIWMLNEMIDQDETSMSRFLPLDQPIKQSEIDHIAQSGKRIILFGAAFGLVDLVEISSVGLPNNSTVIETGGMKTRRREMGRQELHKKLADGFDVARDRIHSEYGMAELLSQAYATGGKWFRTVPWMQVTIRDPENPQEILPPFYEGLIGIVDLANIHSCSFILTGDKGVMDKKGRFQVLGRWDAKDLRGCNFLIDED